MNTARDATRARPATPPPLQPGRNCWRIERSDRTRLVQDAADYFALVRTAILHAEHSVFVLGWDIHAALDLVPGAPDDGAPRTLADLLHHATRRRRDLRCLVLVWDHSALYTLERDPFTRLRFGWRGSRRVHFRFDDAHPLGASHHEKLVVVDDSVAFAGSIDLTSHRWDTTAHVVDDARRVNALGKPYAPYHDVQLMVQGPAAAALGELARTRWQRLGRQRLPLPRPPRAPAWLPAAAGDVLDADVAIARTLPEFRGRPAHRECEALFVDAIAGARSWIYLENQYFTDPVIARALAARLREPHGPEVVVVGPCRCEGWLEKNTMGVLRSRVVAELRAADQHDRLRIVYPIASRRAGVPTFVHSKVMVVDGELFRVGSANLARRSMGMDGECDLAVVASGAARVQQALVEWLQRLLAEHTGSDVGEVRAVWDRTGSLVRVVDELATGDRALVPLADEPAAAPQPAMQDLVDPHEPMAFVANFASALPELAADTRRQRWLVRVLPVAVVLLVVAASWRVRWFGSARTFADFAADLAAFPHSPWLVAAATVTFAIAGLTFVPLRVLMVAAAIVVGPLYGALATVVGTAVAAALALRIGGAITPRRLVRWIGDRAYRLLRLLHRPEALPIATLFFVPVVSTTTLTLLSGVARVPRGAFAKGIALGLAPALLAATAIGGLWRHAILHREPWTAALGAVLAIVSTGATLQLRRRLLAQHARQAIATAGERSRFG